MQKSSKIWMNGTLVPWDDAKVHVMTVTLHYGIGAFEGIRYYEQKGGGSAIFRHREHVERLFDSAKILGIEIPYSQDDILKAEREVVRVNGLPSGYIRPLVYMSDGSMGLAARNPIHVAIMTWAWGAYLGEDGVKNGIRAKFSSYTRQHINSMMTKAKACGAYINSILAKHEALKAGYQEAILLDANGYVAEGTGENLFIVRRGQVKTAPIATVLEGITRASAVQLLRDQGHEVIEERFTRDELWTADEVFMTGTAAEITPVREVDDRIIGTGKPGKVTKLVQDLFHRVVRGEEKRYEEWLDRV